MPEQAPNVFYYKEKNKAKEKQLLFTAFKNK
jgi:hypothetical protein